MCVGGIVQQGRIDRQILDHQQPAVTDAMAQHVVGQCSRRHMRRQRCVLGAGGTDEPRLPKFMRATWTAWAVFAEVEHERIHVRLKELLEEGVKFWIAAYNIALSELWKQAVNEGKGDEYENLAEEWTAQGPDASLVAK